METKNVNVENNTSVNTNEDAVLRIVKNQFDLNKLLISTTDKKLNDELLVINRKSWSDLTDNELKKLPKFEAFLKLVKENNFGKKTMYFALYIKFTDDIQITRKLTKDEASLAKACLPQFFDEKGVPLDNKHFYLPVKFISFETSNKETGETFRNWQYTSYLCEGIYIRSGKRRANEGRLNNNQLRLLCINNSNENNKKIQFIDLGYYEPKVTEDDELYE